MGDTEMTQEQKVIANQIFNSISIVITEDIQKKYKTLDDQLRYTRQEKERLTREKLAKRGILL